MFLERRAVAVVGASAIVVGTGLALAGCGPERIEHDQAVNYTAESLAQELVIRYRALQPSAQVSKLAPGQKVKKSGASKAAVSKKSMGKATKSALPSTIDDVLEDIKSKMTLIKGSSPAETTKKMIETVVADRTLKDADRAALSELVGRLDD
jgi:hypothetical protein